MKNVRSDEQYYNAILGPIVTEKTNLLGDDDLESGRYYVFEVVSDATKAEVRRAVKLLFKGDAVKVQLLNRKGKTGRTIARGKRARHAGLRRAYVRLKEGQDIDLVNYFGDY